MDVHLVDLLSHFGVISDTAANRGWKALSYGQLVAAAVFVLQGSVARQDLGSVDIAARWPGTTDTRVLSFEYRLSRGGRWDQR